MFNRTDWTNRRILNVYIIVKIAPKFRMIKGKEGLINGKISWIIISFDNDKTSILLTNKPIIEQSLINIFLLYQKDLLDET